MLAVGRWVLAQSSENPLNKMQRFCYLIRR
jgi:hypothetical protein